MKTKSKISGYIPRRRAAALLFLGAIVAFCSAISLTGQDRKGLRLTCIPPPPDMVSWWPGDGNTDDIVGGNNGTLIGHATYAAGEVGQAFSVDGSHFESNYVQVPDAANLDFEPNAPITVDMWVYGIGNEGGGHLLGKRVGCGGSGINYQMAFNTTNHEGLSFGGDGGGVITGRNLPPNIWTHLAGTYDGSTFRFYINGKLVGTGTGTLGLPNDAPLLIGGSGDCPGFLGLIDEAEIFSRALTQPEIQAIVDAGSAGKCKPLRVTSSDPACDSVVFNQLTDFVINLSDPVQPSTVQASDFTVNGTPADSFTLSNNNTTIAFHYISSPVTTEGEQTMHIPAGAFLRDPDGNPVSEFDCTFRYDATLLAVTDTLPPVGGTFAPPAPRTYQYDVNWNEPIDPTSVEATDLALSGSTTATVTNVEVINGNTTARFTLYIFFGGSLTADIAAGAITDQFGNPNAAFSGSYTVKGPLCDSPPPDLVSWWPGDGNADDIVGSNNGTLEGGATFAAGEVGQAFSFNSVDDFVRILGSTSLQPATITLDAWVNPQVFFASYQKIISKDFRGDGTWNPPYASYMLELLNMQPFAQININGTLVDCVSPEAVPIGSFTHIAATYDGTAIRVYQNGVLENTVSAAGTISYGNLTDLAFGMRSPYAPGEAFTGILDEADIYDRALSEAEIQAIYKAGSEGKCKPPSITLSAAGRKVGGINTSRLTWSGATSTDVDVYRDGVVIVTTANDGLYIDSTGDTGRARYTYRVCEAGTATCSNDARVRFLQ
jgi:hypothetical protein